MQEIGTVVSTLEGPNSNQFSFVLKDSSGRIPVRKGQFVQLQTEEGLLIARVAEVVKSNRYFERVESVREYSRMNRELPEFFPVDKWECLVANATALGIFTDGMQKRVGYPPSPGLPVSLVDENVLSQFLGLDTNGLNLGNLEFHEILAKLNLTKLFQKHCSILAQTGAGKSYLMSCIIEEILDRDEGMGRPAVIIIDPHGEYVGFSEDRNYLERTRIFGRNNLKIATHKLSAREISELQPFISSVARRELDKFIKELKNRKQSYDMQALVDELEASEIKPNIKEPLVSWLNDLNSTGLFSNIDSPTIDQIAVMGQLSIIDLSETIQLRDKQVIVTHLARKLFEARRAGKIPPFVLVVEEAHQFSPEKVERSGAISKNVIETIAREGRKFNASLVLVSQRPIQLSTTALSQCNTSILLRIVNPYDIRHIMESCEAISSEVMEMLPGLKVGEAIVTGAAVTYPILVHIRERKSKESSKIGVKLEDAAKKFSQEAKLKDEDLEAFR